MDYDLGEDGSLSAARAGLIDTVKRAPADAGARMFLWQVMALQGEWDKAATQLRSLATISAEAQMLASVYGQALGQEKVRAEAYAGRGAFPVLVSSSPWVDVAAEALGAFCAGRADEGERLRDQAFSEAGDTPGIVGDRKFGWIADIDPRLGPCFEAIVAGRWGLVAFEAVDSFKTEGPKDLRDIVWLPVQMALRSGQSAAALLPARYPGTEDASDALKLGRGTEWRGETPVGQRVWSTDTDLDVGVLDFQEIKMV